MQIKKNYSYLKEDLGLEFADDELIEIELQCIRNGDVYEDMQSFINSSSSMGARVVDLSDTEIYADYDVWVQGAAKDVLAWMDLNYSSDHEENMDFIDQYAEHIDHLDKPLGKEFLIAWQAERILEDSDLTKSEIEILAKYFKNR